MWLSLWVSKIFAHFLPGVIQFLAGVVSPAVRKYALIIKAVQIPLSLVGWAAASLATFTPLMTRNPDAIANPKLQTLQNWQIVLRQILGALLVCTIIFLIERILIQLISVNYHRKQFDQKINENKRSVFLLGLLYDASRALFPEYCNEFAEEDYVINDALNLSSLGGKGGKKGGANAAPMRLLHNMGRVGDKVGSAFGTIAQEITGKKVFDLDSGHTIVVEALEKNRACEALAKRLWMSFVCEGREELYQDDIIEVLGAQYRSEAEECFAALDRDGNGDISLDEMIMTVTEIGRSRKSIASSMHDVDQAIHVLDSLLATVVAVISLFVFVAFLNKSFTTTLATAGTALLSLSFVFAASCQEVLGSCIFLFVKHPFDIGDRVDITSEQLIVERISLLFTIFKRVTNGKTVQVPNIVLNNLWVENITRSKAMREQIPIFVHFETSFEDISALKSEMQKFVLDKDNNRDYQPEVDVEVIGIAEMNKLELRVEIKHKSNWANEAIRAGRRSKFMCALVLALRRVPIYSPGGGDAALGSANAPSYSVAVTPEVAQSNKAAFAAAKEAKRLFPSKPAEPQKDVSYSTSADFPTGTTEYLAVQTLNSRSAALDPSRDETWQARDDISTLDERTSMDRDGQSMDEVRGLLNRDPSKGRRQPNQGAMSQPSLQRIDEPLPQRGPSNVTYASPPAPISYDPTSNTGQSGPPAWPSR